MPGVGEAVAVETGVAEAVGSRIAVGVEAGSKVAVGRTDAVVGASIGVGEGAMDCVTGSAELFVDVEGSRTDVIGGSDGKADGTSAAATTLGVAPSMKSISVPSEYDAGLGVGVLYGNRGSTESKSSGNEGTHAIPTAIMIAGSKISRAFTNWRLRPILKNIHPSISCREQRNESLYPRYSLEARWGVRDRRNPD